MTDPLLIETTDRVLSSVATFEAIEAAEQARWSSPIWEAVAEIGLPWISVPEAHGGVGGTISDAVDVLVQAGRHAAPLPLAETGLLGGWLLAAAGVDVGDGPLSVLPGLGDDDLRLEGGRLVGTAHRVPWASSVERVAGCSTGRSWSAHQQRAPSPRSRTWPASLETRSASTARCPRSSCPPPTASTPRRCGCEGP